MTTLSDRMKKYEEVNNYGIISRLPIVVRAEIRNFSRLSRNLEEPYCPELWRIMREAMFSSVMEIDGAILSYHHGAEVNFVIRGVDNNYTDFYGNKVQKICSTIASLSSINFMKHYMASDDPPDIIGEAIFEVTVIPMPNVIETMNYLLWRQQIAVSNAVSAAVEYEMSKSHDRETVLSLNRKSVAEKKDLLYNECNISFEEYPTFFKLGSICYKTPKIEHTSVGEVVKRKWNLDIDIPDFLDDRDFVMNIIQTGQDVMRPDRDIILQNDT